MTGQPATGSAEAVGASAVADIGKMIPLSSILVEPYPRPETIEENLSRLTAEFPGWDFWWSPCSGGNYWAGRVGEKGSVKERTPDAVAEQIAKESRGQDESVSAETGHMATAGTRKPGRRKKGLIKMREFMLCPHCCTIEDVLGCEYNLMGHPPLARCARCRFTFPVLPGEEAAGLTLAAMLEHDCLVPDERCMMGERGDWAAVGESIINQMHNLEMSSQELLERILKGHPEQAQGSDEE